jgi:DNA-binding LytR/AlgR family response regulator
MPNLKHPDAVTPEYIEAYRLGVFIRTPIDNIAFFQAEHKAVVAHTKSNGSFTLDIPLVEIEATLGDKVMRVHRAYLVMTGILPGRSNWRKGSHWVFEVITSVRFGDRLGACPHIIPISRRLVSKVRKQLAKESA